MAGIELDLITYTLLLWNLGGVGVLTSQCWQAPAVLQQSELITLAALCAYWLMVIPPWTTWFLVLSVALYDVLTALSMVPPASSSTSQLMMFEAGPFAYGVQR
jgi:presenilin 1